MLDAFPTLFLREGNSPHEGRLQGRMIHNRSSRYPGEGSEAS